MADASPTPAEVTPLAKVLWHVHIVDDNEVTQNRLEIGLRNSLEILGIEIAFKKWKFIWQLIDAAATEVKNCTPASARRFGHHAIAVCDLYSIHYFHQSEATGHRAKRRGQRTVPGTPISIVRAVSDCIQTYIGPARRASTPKGEPLEVPLNIIVYSFVMESLRQVKWNDASGSVAQLLRNAGIEAEDIVQKSGNQAADLQLLAARIRAHMNKDT